MVVVGMAAGCFLWGDYMVKGHKMQNSHGKRNFTTVLSTTQITYGQALLETS